MEPPEAAPGRGGVSGMALTEGMPVSAKDWDQQQYWERHANASDAASGRTETGPGPSPGSDDAVRSAASGPPASTEAGPLTTNTPPGSAEVRPPTANSPRGSADPRRSATGRPRGSTHATPVAASRTHELTRATPLPTPEPRSTSGERGGRYWTLRGRLLLTGVTAVLIAAGATVAVAYATSPGRSESHDDPGQPAYVLPPDPDLPKLTLGASDPPPTNAATAAPPTTAGVSPHAPVPPSPPPAKNPATPATTTSKVVNPPAAPPAVVTNPAGGMVVRLVNRASGRMVGVARAGDGAPIVQLSDTGTRAQWRLDAAGPGCFQLVNVESGRAVDNPDGTYVDGTQMQQWELVPGNTNQTWCLRSVGSGWFSVRNQTSGSLLDLRDGGTADGTPIQQWSADPAAPDFNQSWQLIRVS
jgi:hypothetical protein